MFDEKKICVLMSTYNGDQFLEEQIESILKQKNVKIELLVRDDGSNDKTQSILDKYKNRGQLSWYNGKDLGCANSFWDLILNSPNADYYAFADQDDYWLDNKLARAVEILEKKEPKIPLLYFSKKTIVDQELNPIDTEDEPVRGVSLEYSLLKGFAAGCTMVFNKRLLDLLLLYKPKVMTMHDSWILKVAGATGEVIYDSKSYILYRQHGNNTIGSTTRLKEFSRHIKRIRQYRKDTMRSDMAKQLLDNYCTYMSEKDKDYTFLLANIRNSPIHRIKMLFSKYYKTQVSRDIIPFKIFFILGWL